MFTIQSIQTKNNEIIIEGIVFCGWKLFENIYKQVEEKINVNNKDKDYYLYVFYTRQIIFKICGNRNKNKKIQNIIFIIHIHCFSEQTIVTLHTTIIIVLKL